MDCAITIRWRRGQGKTSGVTKCKVIHRERRGGGGGGGGGGGDGNTLIIQWKEEGVTTNFQRNQTFIFLVVLNGQNMYVTN